MRMQGRHPQQERILPQKKAVVVSERSGKTDTENTAEGIERRKKDERKRSNQNHGMGRGEVPP